MAAELKVCDTFIIQIQTVKVRKLLKYIRHTNCSEPFIVSFSILLVWYQSLWGRGREPVSLYFQKKAMKLQQRASRSFHSKTYVARHALVMYEDYVHVLSIEMHEYYLVWQIVLCLGVIFLIYNMAVLIDTMYDDVTLPLLSTFGMIRYSWDQRQIYTREKSEYLLINLQRVGKQHELEAPATFFNWSHYVIFIRIWGISEAGYWVELWPCASVSEILASEIIVYFTIPSLPAYHTILNHQPAY